MLVCTFKETGVDNQTQNFSIIDFQSNKILIQFACAFI